MIGKSKIFLDGGDPTETKAADELLKKAGHEGLDGQTTNPTLIAKRFASSQPSALSHEPGQANEQDAIAFYKKTVEEMAQVTSGPISIQVIANEATSVEEMLSQARDRISWIPNGVIKFPCTDKGIAAAETFCQEGPVNLTLNFSQTQAAAVYIATKTHNYDVYVSPFVGRLDDRGENGMDVVASIVEMYKAFGDHHVQVLTASVRSVKQIQYALWLGSDIITIPYKVLQEWGKADFSGPQADFLYDAPGLTEIPYQELSLDVDWHELDIHHDLTTAGLAKFWEDWKSIVQ